MQAFPRLLRMELRRAVQSGLFPAGYLAMLVTLLMNIYLYSTTDSNVSVAYFLEYSFIGSLSMLYYVWGVLPHGLSYCTDKRSGFLRQIAVRCPVKSYCAAKCWAAFLSSALSTAMAVSTFLLILSFFRPLDNDIYLYDHGYRTWFPGHPVFYFLIAAVILALASGLFSVLALWISSYIQNPFAVLASPLLLYYTQGIVLKKLGLGDLWFLNFASMFHFMPGFSSPAANFFYACGYLSALAAFLGILFTRRVEKERQNG